MIVQHMNVYESQCTLRMSMNYCGIYEYLQIIRQFCCFFLYHFVNALFMTYLGIILLRVLFIRILILVIWLIKLIFSYMAHQTDLFAWSFFINFMKIDLLKSSGISPLSLYFVDCQLFKLIEQNKTIFFVIKLTYALKMRCLKQE